MKKVFFAIILLPLFLLGQTSYVYYAFNDDPWTFNRRDTDGSNPLVIYEPPAYSIFDAAMDASIEKVYFHERSTDNSWIYQSNYDGTSKITVKSSTARYYSMTAGDGYIFYSYQDDPWSVRRCDADGSNDIQLYLNPSYGSIIKMGYDAENDYLYCYEYNYDDEHNRIFRINNDGSSFTTVYNNCPPITAVTAGAGYFYYQANADPWNFSRRNADGSSETLIYTPPTGLVRACAYDAFNDQLYFYDHDGADNRYFYTSDPDGSNRTTFFSGFTQNINCVAAPCIDPSEVPLPIELESCELVQEQGNIIIRWTTASETETSHFLIVRDDEVIGRIEAQGTTSEPHQYEFTDRSCIPGIHIYQLADVAWDGQIVYHDLSAIDFNSELQEMDIVLENACPNPFNPRTAISYQLTADSRVELTIYDISGEKVTTLINDEVPAGYHTILWDASGYSSGIYVYCLKAGDFVETKKMVLMK